MSGLFMSVLFSMASSALAVPSATYAKAFFPGPVLHAALQSKTQQATASNWRLPRYTAQQISKNIQTLVLKDLKTQPRDQPERWHFTPDHDLKKLSIAESRGPSSVDPGDPYVLLLEAQFDVESMTQFLAESIVPVPDWMSLLQENRSDIYQSIVDLQSTRNRDKVLAALERRSRDMNPRFEAVKNLIVKTYQAHGYQVSIVAGYEDYHPVPVATDPAGGTVRVMKYLTYKKCLAFRIQKTLWPWLTLNQSTVRLVGRYRYLVTWPNGKNAEGDVSVRSADSLVFRPLP